MISAALRYEQEDSLAVITLTKPESGNLITTRTAAALVDACRDIGGRETVRAVILTGGSTFSRGTAPGELARGPSAAAAMEELACTTCLASLDVPVIAAIAGDAFGQGLELALACDIRLCADDARFAMDQLTGGLMPWDGGTQRLPRLIGRGRALEMILQAQVIDAAEAHRIGLVGAVTSSAELLPVAMALAQQLSARAPLAIRYCREAVIKGMDLTLPQGLRLEADLYFLLHTTQDRTEGITAFREKRSPSFTGS